MNHDETLIFEDLQALSNEEYSALPKFNRVKIYNPRDYDIRPDGDKIHVLAEYNGTDFEDDVFNQLNDKDFPSEFNGVEINWNPISTKQSGTIEQYLEHLVKMQEAFEKEKESIVNAVADKETFEGLYKVARAVEVAVAGKHNLIIEGKDSKSRDSFTENLALYLTPDITPEEQKSVEQIYSSVGLSSGAPSVPFRKPTPDIYIEKMVGGGPRLAPGECSLAHNGILFLEKAEQFRSSALSMLRVPLETGNIILARAGRSTQFPSKLQVISTMRPSSDGNYGSKYDTCADIQGEINVFRRKIENSIMSKIEIREFFEKDENDKRIFNPYEARQRIRTAYEIQRKRGIFNRDLKTEDISKYCKLDEKCADFLKKNVSKDEFSQRDVTNILKISLTLANMEGREQIQLQDLNEAYNLSLPAVEKHREISLDKSIDTEKAKINILANRIAGLCVRRHLSSQTENMERYNFVNSEIYDVIKNNVKEIKEFGKENVLELVTQHLEKQDVDINLVGKNQSAQDECSFVIEALDEDMGNILKTSQIPKRIERKSKAEEKEISR